MRVLFTMAAVALAATALATDTEEKPEDVNALNEMALGISIPYRASEQLEEIWKLMRSDSRRDDWRTPAAFNSSLRQGVWRLNGMREALCADRFMVKMTCVPPFVPKWAFETQKDAPSMEELDARTLELSSEVEPLFAAACARLLGKVPQEIYVMNCSLE